MQRSAVPSPSQFPIPLRRLGERLLAEHRHHRVVSGAEPLQPVEEVARKVHRRRSTAAQEGAELGDRAEGEVGHRECAGRRHGGNDEVGLVAVGELDLADRGGALDSRLDLPGDRGEIGPA